MRLIPSKSPCFLYLEGRYCCFGPGSTGAGEIASQTASGDRLILRTKQIAMRDLTDGTIKQIDINCMPHRTDAA